MRAGTILFAVLLATPFAAAAGNRDLSVAIGKALFERAWVPAPSSTKANDGLGPLFNARACVSCHAGLDRTAATADPSGRFAHQGMVLKLSNGEGRPDPAYGAQLQTAAVQGLATEGALVHTEFGATIQGLAFGPLDASTRIGLRAAPALRGLGRLADVPDAAILALADPADLNGDGISGRANLIGRPDGTTQLGRFGLKASNATLRDQVDLAFALDLGMSTPAHPAPEGDCPQAICRAAPHGGDVAVPEIRGDLAAMLTDYLASVPAPPSASNAEGALLFAATGCTGCHTPALPSARGEVRAHTDLLLHDLGPGLDGGATEPGVAPTEWRTAPLWGVSRALAADAGLLHDGRARTVAGAIALHGGEATRVRRQFDALPEQDRARLLRYVEGL